MSRISMFIAGSIMTVGACLMAVTTAEAAPSKKSIKKSIQRSMEEFQVPGMAVSVVYDGDIYYSAGHGILEIGTKDPVDDNTLFQIASVSKAFTTATLALLVDEGKLGWEDKVIDHLPEFRMYDAWVTREFTIRDLLTHRSGLPLGAGDLLLFPAGNTTMDEVVYAMRHLKPSSSFRSQFDYDNMLYLIAGEVVKRVTGEPFEEILEQRLLVPLGMNDCSSLLSRAGTEFAKATPHLLIDGELQITKSDSSDIDAAAGGINCSARSMTKWMSFVLNKGLTAEGVQLISEAQFEQLLSPVTLQAPRGYMIEHAGSHLSAYALGWNVSTFYGQPMLSHGGALWGTTTFIMVLPKQGLAIFASNNQMSPAPRAIVNDIADRFLVGISEEAGKDWISIIDDIYQSQQQEGDTAVEEAAAARNENSNPSLALEKYAGTYRDNWYGDIHISLEDDGRLWFRSARSEALTGPLEHFQYDTFIARWSDRQLLADAYVSFSMSPEGEIERIRMKAVSPTTDFSYDFHDLDLRYIE